MVAPYFSEKPNLSYVRINQNTSDGTGPSIKTYITKGLVSSDPLVVNASLLHPSLVAQPTVRTTVETPYWGNLELPINTQDGPKQLSKSGETVSLENRSDSTPVACVASSSGAAPQNVAFNRPASKQPLTSVPLSEGVIRVEPNPQQVSSSTPNLYSTPPTTPQSTPPASPPTTCASVGPQTKRKMDEVDQVDYPQVRKKFSTQSRKLIILKSRPDLIQENQRLERSNKILVEENRELREKLDLLSKILKDPRKRDMLNARLERMQKAAC